MYIYNYRYFYFVISETVENAWMLTEITCNRMLHVIIINTKISEIAVTYIFLN